MFGFSGLLPNFRDIYVSENQQKWVTNILSKMLACKYSKLPAYVFVNIVTMPNKTSKGRELAYCLKSKWYYLTFKAI